MKLAPPTVSAKLTASHTVAQDMRLKGGAMNRIYIGVDLMSLCEWPWWEAQTDLTRLSHALLSNTVPAGAWPTTKSGSCKHHLVRQSIAPGVGKSNRDRWYRSPASFRDRRPYP